MTTLGEDTHHTTVGNQAAEMQPSVAVLGGLEGFLDYIILGELALLDGLIDADDILPDNATGTNIQMADL